MDINTLENVREAVHGGSLAILCIVILFAVVGTVKPHLLRGIFKEFAERKFILAGSVFICLLCGTVFTATQSISRPYESNREGVSNTAGSLEQPNRQVYGEDGSEETTDDSELSQPGEVLGSRQPRQSPQQENSARASASQPQESNNTAQAPAPTSSTPPTNNEKKCEIVQLGPVCI